jgi:hypothetical protein
MKSLLALTVTLSLGCAIPRGPGAPLSIPVSVRSHNASPVDVYLLCGEQNAEWLGEVLAREAGLFHVPTSRADCVHGLNFFIVHRGLNRGYWVGPVRPRMDSGIHLSIEKYAGLSVAYVR